MCGEMRDGFSSLGNHWCPLSPNRHTVVFEDRIDSHDRQIVDDRLGHDQPIPGVAVRAMQQAGGESMHKAEAQHGNTDLAKSARQILGDLAGQLTEALPVAALAKTTLSGSAIAERAVVDSRGRSASHQISACVSGSNLIAGC
jgi:hypothetical protein